MSRGRSTPSIPGLFSTAPRDVLLAKPSPSTDTAASSPRYVLPSDLPAAIKHLNDQELDQLQAAVTTEMRLRGKNPEVSEKVSKREEPSTVSLTPGKLSAVRAAFKAGVTPASIARQFGIPQSDVRKVLASK